MLSDSTSEDNSAEDDNGTEQELRVLLYHKIYLIMGLLMMLICILLGLLMMMEKFYKMEKCSKIMKKGILLILFLFASLVFVGFIQAKDLVSESGVIYSDRILEQFDKIRGTNETFVDVIIHPKDVSYKEKIISDLSSREVGRIVNRDISEFFSAKITEEVFFELLEDDRIKSIYYNAPIELTLEESAQLINADDVWSSGYTGEGIKVCIIDSGIDTDHPNLPTPIAEQCYVSGNGCPNGLSSDNSAEDDNGHGTRVAGVIASQDLFDHGIAHDADLYVVRVTNSEGQGILADVANAIDWCRNQEVDVISMSLQKGNVINDHLLI
jgi:subtilisin family serine protease